MDKTSSNAADVLIALAYFAIPVELVYFASQNRLPTLYKLVIGLFTVFILACGLSHLCTVIDNSGYVLLGIKIITALVSLLTAVVLIFVFPRVMHIPEQVESYISESVYLKKFREFTQMTRRILETKYILSTAKRELQKMFPHVDIINELEEYESMYEVIPVYENVYIKIRTDSVSEDDKQFLVDVAAQLDVVLQQAKVVKDLVDKKKELEVTNNALEELVGFVSHEIRNSLNGIINITAFMMETKLDEQQKEYMTLMEDSGRDMLRILTNILERNKIESKVEQVKSSPFQVKDIINSLSREFGNLFKQKNLRYVVECDAIDEVNGDSFKISQVISNLLNNALKFTEKGSVSLRCKILDETNEKYTLKFEVEDTGIGIHPNTLQKLFNPYYQGDDTSIQGKYGGSGLGLHICKKFVELMHGFLNAESTVNVGTKFWFELQLQKSLQKQKLVNQ